MIGKIEPAVEGGVFDQILEREKRAVLQVARQFDPRAPRDLEPILLKLLSKRPSVRYESAASLAAMPATPA